MRHCARSYSAYRYGFASLIGFYAILWTGGTVWHGLTCGHHHHSHAISCEVTEHNATPSDHCCHDHHADSRSSDTPAAPPHDEENCPICQWFSQAQSTPEMAMSKSDEQLIGFTTSFSAESPCTIIVGFYQSRAPPA